MFNFFQKKPQGQTIKLKLSGLHCTSCSLNIDGELEDLDGVISSSTSYASQESVIIYDAEKVKVNQFHKVIKKLGYTVLT